MAPAILSVIAFLALAVWRFVFAGPRRRPLLRAIALKRQRHSNLLAEGPRISGLGGAAVIAERPLENRGDDLDRLDRKDRAKRYLKRITALPRPTQGACAYVLHVRQTQLHVHPR